MVRTHALVTESHLDLLTLLIFIIWQVGPLSPVGIWTIIRISLWTFLFLHLLSSMWFFLLFTSSDVDLLPCFYFMLLYLLWPASLLLRWWFFDWLWRGRLLTLLRYGFISESEGRLEVIAFFFWTWLGILFSLRWLLSSLDLVSCFLRRGGLLGLICHLFILWRFITWRRWRRWLSIFFVRWDWHTSARCASSSWRWFNHKFDFWKRVSILRVQLLALFLFVLRHGIGSLFALLLFYHEMLAH